MFETAFLSGFQGLKKLGLENRALKHLEQQVKEWAIYPEFCEKPWKQWDGAKMVVRSDSF